MNGRELIARLLRQNPQLRIILTSGSEQTLAETPPATSLSSASPSPGKPSPDQVRALLDLSPA